MILSDRLFDVARRDPTRELVVDPVFGRASYGEIAARVGRLASALRDMGLGPGDVAVVELPNWTPFLEIHLALTAIGAVTVNRRGVGIRGRPRLAAVKGTFEGTVRLADKTAPESYRMLLEGRGGPGFVRGDAVIRLSEETGGTRVAYSAEVQVGGLIAAVGQRMLGAVSRTMADQFFTRIQQLLRDGAT